MVINDKSQDSTAKHLIFDGLLHYNFIVQFDGKGIFTVSEHLAKLQAKWLIVLYAPFALAFCSQRCRTCQISKITCVLRTKIIIDCCYVKGRLM